MRQIFCLVRQQTKTGTTFLPQCSNVSSSFYTFVVSCVLSCGIISCRMFSCVIELCRVPSSFCVCYRVLACVIEFWCAIELLLRVIEILSSVIIELWRVLSIFVFVCHRVLSCVIVFCRVLSSVVFCWAS